MSSKDSLSQTATVYGARAAWAEGSLADHFGTRITRAVFNGDSISLDWAETFGATASTWLTRDQGSTFKGKSVWAADSAKEDQAEVEAVLYSNDNGHVLIGEEKWKSGKIDWFVVQFFDGKKVAVPEPRHNRFVLDTLEGITIHHPDGRIETLHDSPPEPGVAG